MMFGMNLPASMVEDATARWSWCTSPSECVMMMSGSALLIKNSMWFMSSLLDALSLVSSKLSIQSFFAPMNFADCMSSFVLCSGSPEAAPLVKVYMQTSCPCLAAFIKRPPQPSSMSSGCAPIARMFTSATLYRVYLSLN